MLADATGYTAWLCNGGYGFVVFARMFKVVMVTENSNTSGGCGFVGPLSLSSMTSSLITTAAFLVIGQVK